MQQTREDRMIIIQVHCTSYPALPLEYTSSYCWIKLTRTFCSIIFPFQIFPHEMNKSCDLPIPITSTCTQPALCPRFKSNFRITTAPDQPPCPTKCPPLKTAAILVPAPSRPQTALRASLQRQNSPQPPVALILIGSAVACAGCGVCIFVKFKYNDKIHKLQLLDGKILSFLFVFSRTFWTTMQFFLCLLLWSCLEGVIIHKLWLVLQLKTLYSF